MDHAGRSSLERSGRNHCGGGGGDGYLISDKRYGSFVFQTFVRTSRHANGGIFFRWGQGEGRGYEAQIYNVPEATNPTGSIYGIVPAGMSDSRDGEWFLMQIISDRSYAAILVNGEKVAESFLLEMEDHGNITLQMHSRDATIEFRKPRIRMLGRE